MSAGRPACPPAPGSLPPCLRCSLRQCCIFLVRSCYIIRHESPTIFGCGASTAVAASPHGEEPWSWHAVLVRAGALMRSREDYPRAALTVCRQCSAACSSVASPARPPCACSSANSEVLMSATVGASCSIVSCRPRPTLRPESQSACLRLLRRLGTACAAQCVRCSLPECCIGSLR